MARTYKNERDVKAEVKRILDSLDIWWYMPVQTGYGVRGIPDFVCCVRGTFVGIETKFGKNKLSAWQERIKECIVSSEGEYFVINEDNVHELPEHLGYRRVPI